MKGKRSSVRKRNDRIFNKEQMMFIYVNQGSTRLIQRILFIENGLIN